MPDPVLPEFQITFNVCLVNHNRKPKVLIYRHLETKEQVENLISMLMSNKKISAFITFNDELKAYAKLKEFQEKK